MPRQTPTARRIPLRWLAIALTLLLLAGATASPARAQAASLTLDLTASATRAKVGDLVTYAATVTNTGSEDPADVLVFLGLPDALDAQSVDCPGTTDTVTGCRLSLAAGQTAVVRFVVRVGSRNRVVNGDVTAAASSGGVELAGDRLPALKIVGPRG